MYAYCAMILSSESVRTNPQFAIKAIYIQVLTSCTRWHKPCAIATHVNPHIAVATRCAVPSSYDLKLTTEYFIFYYVMTIDNHVIGGMHECVFNHIP